MGEKDIEVSFEYKNGECVVRVGPKGHPKKTARLQTSNPVRAAAWIIQELGKRDISPF